MSEIGHNSGDAGLDSNPDNMTEAANGRLKSLVDRLERLNEDKDAISEDIKQVFAEAKGEGFDAKALRRLIRLRAQDPAKRQEEDAILDLYIAATGGL